MTVDVVELQVGGGLVGLVLLVLLVWAVYHIVQSDRGFLAKMVWIAAVFVFPGLGWLAWLLFGPRARRYGSVGRLALHAARTRRR